MGILGNMAEILTIKCKHDLSEHVNIFINNEEYKLKEEKNFSILTANINPGVCSVKIIQKSIFDKKYWWLTLIPFFWLIYGGMLFNYYLGYDGKHAQAAFNVHVKLNEHKTIKIELKRNTVKSNTRFDRIYYNFITKDVNITEIPASSVYILKWRCAQLVLPVLCLFVVLFGVFHVSFDLKGLLLFIFVIAFIIYRVVLILITKSAHEISNNQNIR